MNALKFWTMTAAMCVGAACAGSYIVGCATVSNTNDPGVIGYTADLQYCANLALIDGGSGWTVFDICAQQVNLKYGRDGGVSVKMLAPVVDGGGHE